MSKKYFITTYGCQLNVHESEKLAGVLKEDGYEPAQNIKDADIILFNTCAIREGAEDRVFGNVGALKKLKKENRDKIIAVCGCMTQQKEKANKLYEMFPFVDIVFGTSNLYKFKEFLNKSTKRLLAYDENFNLIGEDMPFYRTSGENAWVNIMQGCNNFCTYCIVPYVRGRERSRKSDDILKEVKEAVNQGYKKITLLGQNVNSYGQDCGEISFSELLKKVCKIQGDFKVTFMTSHPKDLTSDVIDVIAENEKILKEIHLPVQSGSNKILEKMNRKYTVEKYLSIIDEIKKKIPNVRITTDIIVGFPGETEEDFNQTCELIKKVGYDGIFAFMYSVREGTVAEKMPNQIDGNIKEERSNKLIELSNKNENEYNESYIGKEVNVLFEEYENGYFRGYTTNYMMVNVPGKKEDEEKLVDHIFTVKILKNNEETRELIGEIRK